ncbi:hypothetical protein B6D52_00600 [Candidatus Parcubacteria bacterium 4484_255]|nr:MAG: hypothetical protein B6D52_00600 [Candidatus Parcubacteria bacterium 4484_255]
MSILEIKKILKKSFNLTRQNPRFLFLGFFLIFFINYEINVIIGILNQITTYLVKLINNIKIPIVVQSKEISNIFILIYNSFQKFNLSNIFVLITIVLFLYLCLMAQIIVISLAEYSKQNPNNPKTSLKKIFLKSHKFLGPTIIIYLLLGIAIFIFLNIPTLFKNYLTSNTLPGWFIISYIIITLLLGLIFGFIAKFSLFFVIIKKEKLSLSIQKSAKFFFENWFTIIKISLSLLIATILFGLIIFLIYTGIFIPTFLFLHLLLHLCSPSFYLIIITALTFIVSVIFLMLLSFFAYFQFLVWPLYFTKSVKKM